MTNNQCTISVNSDANAGNWINVDDLTFTSGTTGLTVKGSDVSSLIKSEAKGGVYKNSSGTTGDALAILKSAGQNYARVKVWVNPADGYNNKTRVLAAAKRIKAQGMKLLVDFHYSDTWADPGAQTVPSSWAGHSYSQLKTDVYNHTYDVLNALKSQGTTADMVQVGNEINGGMLWSAYPPPTGPSSPGCSTPATTRSRRSTPPPRWHCTSPRAATCPAPAGGSTARSPMA